MASAGKGEGEALAGAARHPASAAGRAGEGERENGLPLGREGGSGRWGEGWLQVGNGHPLRAAPQTVFGPGPSVLQCRGRSAVLVGS